MIGSLNGAKILVTGGEGFTGIHLMKALREAEAEVVALSRAVLTKTNFEFRIADICDSPAVSDAIKSVNPTHVVHLAAISATRRDDEGVYSRVNVEGAANILKAARDYAPNLQHFTLASSAAVYGDPGPDLVSESRVPAPVNAYGQSKLDMERLADEFDFPTLCVRPFNYTGPGQPDHFIVPKLVKAFFERQPIIELWETESIREFGDVRDAVASYVALIKNHATGVLNLCTGRANSVKDVISTLKKITGHEPEIITTGTSGGLHKLVGDPTNLRSAGANKPIYNLEDTLSFMLKQLELQP